MTGSVAFFFLSALGFAAYPIHNYTRDVTYHALPRFWTSTGFCPAGGVNREDITNTLLSAAVQMNLQQIAALPEGAVTHVRIHWLLMLLEFVQYSQEGVPIYDFGNLDAFLLNLDELGLAPVVEFMANPGDVFVKNPNSNAFLWENFSYQVVRHYLNNLGAAKVLRWRFESWNEPDLVSYNMLNFTFAAYWEYVKALRIGLDAAGQRPEHSLRFALRGPAGLFKSEIRHPLCWNVLKQCNLNVTQCPFDVLTYHRKGNGKASDILDSSTSLLRKLYGKFPSLQGLPISNGEADVIAGWSTPHPYNEDVRYACMLILNVMNHWNAKLRYADYRNLESISHDNAFLSYHPFEFSQRTLLAHFRMNDSLEVHSQFVQKPVYAALGMLAKLGPLAADVTATTHHQDQNVMVWRTTVPSNVPLFLNWILVPQENSTDFANFTLELQLPFELCEAESYAFIIEALEQQRTDPVHIWRTYSAPPYPNATVREMMRRSQTPHLHATGPLHQPTVQIDVGGFHLPWVLQLRVCSNLIAPLRQPHQLTITRVTVGEVLITWREPVNSPQCLRTYQVWFQMANTDEWLQIADNWHLPFPSFQFASPNGNVNGFYKVRGIDIFNVTSQFSESIEYLEL